MSTTPANKAPSIIVALTAVATLLTVSPTWAKADSAAGQQLHAEHCAACHAGRMNGNAATMYTRANRRVKSLSGLHQMIGSCNANLGLGLFPEDEANLAAYLNQQYYKLK